MHIIDFTTTEHRNDQGVFIPWYVSLVCVMSTLTVLTFAFVLYAQAAPPYGGCKEAWQAPHSAGAQACRAQGWTVGPRLVVNPRGVVKASRLPVCRNEDGSGQRRACGWNLRAGDGNGRGASFWLDRRDRAHYVWPASPLVRGWRWVKSGQADALAESEVADATTREWTRCVTRRSRAACADGVSLRW